MNEDGPEGEETTLGAGDAILLLEWPWVAPVLEADGGTSRDSASGDDDTQKDQTEDGDDLCDREPELGLSVLCKRFYASVVLLVGLQDAGFEVLKCGDMSLRRGHPRS